MNALDHLTNVIAQLQTHAAAAGITLAGLMIGIYTMSIMIKNDSSPTARSTRWENLQKVLICAGILAATGAFVQFATGIGSML